MSALCGRLASTCCDLFDDKHAAVLDIDGMLQQFSRQHAFKTPLHVVLGKVQKKLKAVQAKLSKLTAERSLFVQRHLECVTKITQIDKDSAALLEEQVEILHEKMEGLEGELRYAWRALDVLSQEYVKMWQRLEKMEGRQRQLDMAKGKVPKILELRNIKQQTMTGSRH